MTKNVILLNGPSSSGKSTLAAALRELILEKRNELFAIVSIDDHMKLAQDEVIYEDDVYEISGDMCAHALKELQTSAGVIIDHVITSERIFLQLTEAVGAFRLRTVHVTCPADILEQREKERGNRHTGSASASLEYLYPKDGYELTLDTHAMTAGECASAIYRALFS